MIFAPLKIPFHGLLLLQRLAQRLAQLEDVLRRRCGGGGGREERTTAAGALALELCVAIEEAEEEGAHDDESPGDAAPMTPARASMLLRCSSTATGFPTPASEHRLRRRWRRRRRTAERHRAREADVLPVQTIVFAPSAEWAIREPASSPPHVRSLIRMGVVRWRSRFLTTGQKAAMAASAGRSRRPSPHRTSTSRPSSGPPPSSTALASRGRAGGTRRAPHSRRSRRRRPCPISRRRSQPQDTPPPAVPTAGRHSRSGAGGIGGGGGDRGGGGGGDGGGASTTR